MKNSRNYISYSQLVSYEAGRYYEEYILGNRRESKEMTFGKKIADGLKSGSKDKDVEFVRMWTPKVDKREKKLLEVIEGIRIMAELDGWCKVKAIYEYKTGKVKWTQARADNSDQLTIYSMLAWYRYHIYPRLILIWIPTKNDGKKIALTGELPRSFITKRTLTDYGMMLKRLKKAQVGINKLYSNI